MKSAAGGAKKKIKKITSVGSGRSGAILPLTRPAKSKYPCCHPAPTRYWCPRSRTVDCPIYRPLIQDNRPGHARSTPLHVSLLILSRPDTPPPIYPLLRVRVGQKLFQDSRDLFSRRASKCSFVCVRISRCSLSPASTRLYAPLINTTTCR